MPKVEGTRKQRSSALLKQIENGPAIDLDSAFISEIGISSEQAQAIEASLAASYRLWSQTWIVPELSQLVPELRNPK